MIPVRFFYQWDEGILKGLSHFPFSSRNVADKWLPLTLDGCKAAVFMVFGEITKSSERRRQAQSREVSFLLLKSGNPRYPIYLPPLHSTVYCIHVLGQQQLTEYPTQSKQLNDPEIMKCPVEVISQPKVGLESSQFMIQT
jgi:hypothetical protein